MKLLIGQFCLFVVATIISILLLIQFADYFINKKSSFKISKETKILILGNSHPECAFNDSLISNVSNFASSGESSFYALYKLKKVIEQNNQITTVFIEFNNSQIVESEMNRWLWDESFLSHRYLIYSPFLTLTDKFLLFKTSFNTIFNLLPISLSNNLLKIVHHEYNYTNSANPIGGYAYLKKENADSLLKHTDIEKKYDSFKNSREEISDFHIERLVNMVEYCNVHKIQLYLIRSPMPRFFPTLGNEEKFQRIRKLKFKNIEFLDFSKFPLNNNDVVDLEHLNFRGARKFSIWFNNINKMGLLEKSNKQEFINKQISELTNLTK